MFKKKEKLKVVQTSFCFNYDIKYKNTKSGFLYFLFGVVDKCFDIN